MRSAPRTAQPAPGLPHFTTPAAAAAHYRAALGITGVPPAGSAWRLVSHLIARFEGRLHVKESGASFGLIMMFADEACIFIPSPLQRPEEEREDALLHELGHLLLTWRCPATFRLAMLGRAARSTGKYAYWQNAHRHSEELARGFVAAWRAHPQDAARTHTP
jgi:hypothetical protein